MDEGRISCRGSVQVSGG